MNKADPFGDMEAASGLTADDRVTQDQSAPQPEEPIQAGNVGALLCATRMRMAGDLQAIAKILRIRYSYLVAIEDCRYEDLPGSAYSVGFVRAYADYLGLDGNEVVKRLREETNGTVVKTRFEFPVPSGESGLPNGGLLAIAVGMGVIVYGAWYTMTNADRDAVDLIQEMPSRIAVLIEDDSEKMVSVDDGGEVDSFQSQSESVVTDVPVPSAQDMVEADQPSEIAVDATGSSAEEDSEPEVQAVALPEETVSGLEQELVADVAEVDDTAAGLDSELVALETVERSPASDQINVELAAVDLPDATQIAEPDILQSSESLEDVTPEVVENVASDQPLPVQSDEAALPDAPDVAVAASVQTVNSVQSEPTTSQESVSVSSPPSVQEEAVAEPTDVAAVPADPILNEPGPADEVDQVIELRAKSDSWIQVRDGNELLLTRLLREGEVYQVPERDGLTLMTGNAGGLEVFIGGERMPPLGDEGVVRRGVPLSPERLRSGTAPG